MYYAIGHFSEIAGISIDTLRYYEKEELIAVDRDTCGRRRYTDADLRWIQFIRRLKETGMPIREIRRYALLRYRGDVTIEERLEMLRQHRGFVQAEREKWESNLNHLDEKIKIYEDALSGMQKE